MKRALILTEGYLDQSTAKTSHGLLRHSERFEITGVIDSKFSGQKTDEMVPSCNSVSIYESVPKALEEEEADALIIGVATIGGYLPEVFREHMEEAIKNGLDIISGLHHFLNEDEELSSLAEEYDVNLDDIRKSPPLEELHYFQNRKEEMDCLTIPFLGTDSSIGKRTALLEVYGELKRRGVSVSWVATGQTGMLQGSDYGLPLDSIQGDYMVGELEHQIWRAWKKERPDIILIEGQGSISHPAYVCGSRAVLAGSQPDGVVLQHAPSREYRHYREEDIQWPMPTVKHEMDLIELYSGAEVIALGINPEELSEEEVHERIDEYKDSFKIPASDALKDPDKIADAIEDMIHQ